MRPWVLLLALGCGLILLSAAQRALGPRRGEEPRRGSEESRPHSERPSRRDPLDGRGRDPLGGRDRERFVLVRVEEARPLPGVSRDWPVRLEEGGDWPPGALHVAEEPPRARRVLRPGHEVAPALPARPSIPRLPPGRGPPACQA